MPLIPFPKYGQLNLSLLGVILVSGIPEGGGGGGIGKIRYQDGSMLF